MSALAAALSVAAAVSSGQAEPSSAAPSPPPSAARGQEEALWLEVQLDEQPLADSLDALQGGDGRIRLPLGALARLLDLAVVVSPAERRASGWVLREDRTVLLDLAARVLRSGARETPLQPDDAVLRDEEIWVTPELLSRILPVSARVDAPSQTLALRAREPLPLQQRAARAGLRAGLGAPELGAAQVRRVETPYLLFTPPSVDFSLDTGLSNTAPQESVRYDLRLGGDLAYAGFQLFAGSDDGASLSSIRVLLERKAPEGRRAGPFGVTRTAAGDVFTPALSLGVRSVEGRGLISTSRPIEQINAFTRVSFRGELPLGFEVELYVNDVLRGSQATPVNGRYEFRDVSLSYGLNIVRLVFYGPRGERREEVRRINYGAGQLAAGETQFRFGLVQQGVPLVDVGSRERDPLSIGGEGRGDLRFVGEVQYGLTSALTLVGGASHYTPPSGGARSLLITGLRTTFRGFALQADAAADSLGGSAVAAGAAGRAFGVSWIARHSEYRGGFVDELQPRGAFEAVALRRSTDVFVDGQVVLPGLGAVPLALDAHRNERADGTAVLLAEGRASIAVQRFFLSTFFS